MAEGGRRPQQVFDIHSRGTAVDELTKVQERIIRDRTKIHGSKIGTVTTEQPVQGLQLISLAKVKYDSFEVDNDALYHLLEQDELKGRPLAIVSIAGATRTGKSFLLNFFLKYLGNKGWENVNWLGNDSSLFTGGFPWKKGMGPCTQGIEVWPGIFHVPLKDGRECAVMIVDTQGLYDDDTSPDTNAKLMALSTLFSSHQILNIMRHIEYRDLEHLQLCVQFGKAAANMKFGGNKKAFQNLMFLLRDWERNEKLGDHTTAFLREYLKTTSKSSTVQNAKKSISGSFDQVQCFCLPYPGKKVVTKKELSNEDIDANFVKWAKILVESVLHPNNIVIKKIGGKDATPDDLKYLIVTVGKNFVGGELPIAETLLQSVVRANNTKSLSKAVADYREEMSIQIGDKIVKDDDFSKYHAASLDKALKTFNELAKIGDENDKEEFRRQLRKECDDARRSYRETNETRKRKRNREIESSPSIHKRWHMFEHKETDAELKPITLTGINGDKFRVDTDALYYLLEKDELKGKPLAIVSIAGTSRSGKSFIMNFFLKYLRNKGWNNSNWLGDGSAQLTGGFPWRNGEDACTQGINIWPEIFHMPLNDERECAVMIVDSQGLYDNDTSPDTNVKLMSLSTLLSSYQILNLVKKVEERDLEHLELCVSFAQTAVDTRICGKEKAFQSLMFLIRDWGLDEKLGDSTDTYLLPLLQKKSKSPIVQNVKDSIFNSFDQLQCFRMPRPGDKVEKILEKDLHNKDVDERFKVLAKKMVESVLHPDNIVIKKIGNGSEATLNDINNLIGTVGKNFAEGKLPTAETMLQSFVRANNTKSLIEAVAVYQKDMLAQIEGKTMTDEDFNKYHAASFGEATKTFHSLANMGDGHSKEEFLHQLFKECNDSMIFYKEFNERRKSELQHELQMLRVEQLENYRRVMKLVGLSVTDERFERINTQNICEAQDAFDTAAKDIGDVLPQITDMKTHLTRSLSLISSEVAKSREREKEKQKRQNNDVCDRLVHELVAEFEDEVELICIDFTTVLSSKLEILRQKYLRLYTYRTRALPELVVVENNKKILQQKLNKAVQRAEKLNAEKRAILISQFHKTQRECLAVYRRKLRNKIGPQTSDDNFCIHHECYKADALKTFNYSTSKRVSGYFPEIPEVEAQLKDDIDGIYIDLQENRKQQKAAQKLKITEEIHGRTRRIFDEFESQIGKYIDEYQFDIDAVLSSNESDCLKKFDELVHAYDPDIIAKNRKILKNDIKRAIKSAKLTNKNHQSEMIKQFTSLKHDCLTKYKSNMKNVGIEQLNSTHNDEKEKVFKMFDDETRDYGSWREVERLRESLDQEIEELFNDYKQCKEEEKKIEENSLRAESETCMQEQVRKFEKEARKYRGEFTENLEDILKDERAKAKESYETKMKLNSQKNFSTLESILDDMIVSSMYRNKELEELLWMKCRNKGKEFAEEYQFILEKMLNEAHLKPSFFDELKNKFLVNNLYQDEEFKIFPPWGQKIVLKAVDDIETVLKEQNETNKKHRSVTLSSREKFKKWIKRSLKAIGLAVRRRAFRLRGKNDDKEKLFTGALGMQQNEQYQKNLFPTLENLLKVELHSSRQGTGVLKYAAKSLSSGKVISAICPQSSVILEGIEPGDKYSVLVNEVKDDLAEIPIAKSEIQTGKSISKDGGTVEVGGFHLNFPSGAVTEKAWIEICAYVEDVPPIPEEYFSVIPVFDLRSSQKKFNKLVACTLKIPYIHVKKPTVIEIICYENLKWQNISSFLFTEDSTVLFKCDHFSLYAAVISSLPFFFVKEVGLSFDIATKLYCHQDDNFACMTCLDYPPIIGENEKKLEDHGYFLSPLLIDSVSMKVGEAISYNMSCLNPVLPIREWQILLDEKFVKKWGKIEDSSIDEITDKKRIKLQLQVVQVGQPKKNCIKNLKYPLAKANISSATVNYNAAVNLVQGGYARFDTKDGKSVVGQKINSSK